MNKRVIRDNLNLMEAILLFWLYIPHLLFYFFKGSSHKVIVSDIARRKEKLILRIPMWMMFLYYIHNDRYFRNLYYHRIGPMLELLIGWWRPGDRYLMISKTTSIGLGAYLSHPFSTVINAKSIGDNFSCRHLTTIGNKFDGDNNNRPIIGNNVTLGVNVTIIGPVVIGDNVTIGAGSVVVKDIPNNCVAVGNPCRPIKFINNETV